ncbi:hypothetical protein Tco_0634890 [Tanacetum coccineum]
MTPATIKEMINQHVDVALEACRVNRDLGLGNRNDIRGGDGNGNDTRNVNNGGDNGDSNENRNVNGRGDRPGARECTYQDFMKCQPLSFKGTKGVFTKNLLDRVSSSKRRIFNTDVLDLTMLASFHYWTYQSRKYRQDVNHDSYYLFGLALNFISGISFDYIESHQSFFPVDTS